MNFKEIEYFYIGALAILEEEPKFGEYTFDRTNGVGDMHGVFAFLKNGKGDHDVAEFHEKNRATSLCKLLNESLIASNN